MYYSGSMLEVKMEIIICWRNKNPWVEMGSKLADSITTVYEYYT